MSPLGRGGEGVWHSTEGRFTPPGNDRDAAIAALREQQGASHRRIKLREYHEGHGPGEVIAGEPSAIEQLVAQGIGLEIVCVRHLQSYGGIHPQELAGYPVQEAAEMIEDGIAELYITPEGLTP
jgi:hypothetical protein